MKNLLIKEGRKTDRTTTYLLYSDKQFLASGSTVESLEKLKETLEKPISNGRKVLLALAMSSLDYSDFLAYYLSNLSTKET